jgi:uncharacterized membrane protein
MNTVRTLTAVGVVGTAVVGGVLFAFSSFVMAGLRSVPPHDGLVAMQGINDRAVTPAFMTAFLGTAVLCIGLAVQSLTDLGDRAAQVRLGAAVLYLATIVITMAFHVPRNDALALLDPAAPESAAAWRTYARNWTLMNHLRTLTAVGAAVGFLWSLHVAGD